MAGSTAAWRWSTPFCVSSTRPQATHFRSSSICCILSFSSSPALLTSHSLTHLASLALAETAVTLSPLQVSFSDNASLPMTAVVEHAAGATMPFQPLMELQMERHPGGGESLCHILHLGNDTIVSRYLRLRLLGHRGMSGVAGEPSGWDLLPRAVIYRNQGVGS